MQTIFAFFLGMYEFRRALTRSYNDYYLLCTYDRGREWAHTLTFRYFDQ